MALTEERLRTVQEEPGSPPLQPRERLEDPLPQRSPDRAQKRLLVAWIVALSAILLLEPAPAANVQSPVWAEMVATAFFLTFGATIYGLWTGSPWALKASGAAAGLGVVIAVACALTDHHMGWWWAGELAAFTALGCGTLYAASTRG